MVTRQDVVVPWLDHLNDYRKRHPIRVLSSGAVLLTILIFLACIPPKKVPDADTQYPYRERYYKFHPHAYNKKLRTPDLAPGSMPVIPPELLHDKEALAAILQRLYPPKSVSIFAVNSNAKTTEELYVVTARLNQWDIEHMMSRINARRNNTPGPIRLDLRPYRKFKADIVPRHVAVRRVSKYIKGDPVRSAKKSANLKPDHSFIEYRPNRRR